MSSTSTYSMGAQLMMTNALWFRNKDTEQNPMPSTAPITQSTSEHRHIEVLDLLLFGVIMFVLCITFLMGFYLGRYKEKIQNY